MANYLALDFETTGLDTSTCLPIEVGAILFNENFDVIESYSVLCREPEDPPLDPIITELTGITEDDLLAQGTSRKVAFLKLINMIYEADIIFIHNVNFDKTILERVCKEYGYFLPEKEYICTLTNFDWPKKFRCFKLGHLGFDHGIDLRSSGLHRALYDCRVIIELLKLYDIPKIIEYARIPWVFVKGDIMAPWDDKGTPKQTDVAKKLGFQWEKVRYGYEVTELPKTWAKRLKKTEFEKLQEDVNNSERPFRVSIIGVP